MRQCHSIAHTTLEVTTILISQTPTAGISVNLPSNLYSSISDLRLVSHVVEENLVFKAVDLEAGGICNLAHHTTTATTKMRNDLQCSVYEESTRSSVQPTSNLTSFFLLLVLLSKAFNLKSRTNCFHSHFKVYIRLNCNYKYKLNWNNQIWGTNN